MRNLLLTIAYDGTNYHGFQVQQNARSVCAVFQDAVEQVLGKRWDVKGCSRTDTGVHARMYCLSMRCSTDIACDKLALALNHWLPHDIAVLAVRDVAGDFHARYCCTGKEYVYRLHNSHTKDPFSPHLSYRFPFPLEEKLLHREAQDLVGTHDFAAFQSAGASVRDTVRTVHAFRVHREGDKVLFTVSGDGFLYNMVRIMVGTLVEIGAGRRPAGVVPAIIASRDRARAGKTMPACGLYLNRVFYPGEHPVTG